LEGSSGAQRNGNPATAKGRQALFDSIK